MFTLTFIPFQKKKKRITPTRCLGHLTLTGSMKKSLSPWPAAINSISHSSLCLSFLSFFRQIHLHERPLILARGPAGKWQSNQWFHAILPSPSYVCYRPKAVVSVSLINLPLFHDWRDQHVLIILPWFELDQPCVRLHKYSTASERDKHCCCTLHTESDAGQGGMQSDSVFAFPSVWASP